MTIRRTEVTIHATVGMYESAKQGHDKVGVVQEEPNNVSFEARSYVQPIGWLLSKMGYATKIEGIYYNCASLAKRMAQAILHSTPESNKELDAQEIEDIRIIWESALIALKHKGSINSNELVNIYSSAVNRAANFINSEGYFEYKFRLKYRLLTFKNNEDRKTELERRIIAGPKYFFGLFHEWNKTKNSYTDQIQNSMIVYGNMRSPLKEKWVKDACLKKDNEGKYLFLNLFKSPEKLEDWQKLEAIILLKAINDNELSTAVYEAIKSLGPKDILVKAVLANIKI